MKHKMAGSPGAGFKRHMSQQKGGLLLKKKALDWKNAKANHQGQKPGCFGFSENGGGGQVGLRKEKKWREGNRVRRVSSCGVIADQDPRVRRAGWGGGGTIFQGAASKKGHINIRGGASEIGGADVVLLTLDSRRWADQGLPRICPNGGWYSKNPN